MTKRPIGFYLIAFFKLIKGVLFFALAIGALKLLNKDVSDLFSLWITHLHIDLENHLVQNIITRLDLVDNHILKEVSVVAFGFAGLLIAEGWGLLFQKRWAEYMTVIETGLFIPVEIFELIHHTTFTKAGLLAVNCLVVLYLLKAIKKS